MLQKVDHRLPVQGNLLDDPQPAEPGPLKDDKEPLIVRIRRLVVGKGPEALLLSHLSVWNYLESLSML